MAVTLKNFYTGLSNTSITTVYTATNVTSAIDSFSISNTTGGVETIDVYLVPDGGTAGSSNIVIPNKSIADDESYGSPEAVGHYLEPGGTIQIESSSASLTLVISGREIS